MKPPSPEKSPDSVRKKPDEVKVTQILNFIRNLNVPIPSDILQNLPEEERIISIISFTEEDIKKIEKRLTQTLVKILFKYIPPNKEINEAISRFQTNFITNIKQFNITPNQWKECLIKQPSLFARSPETINKNIEEAAKLLGIKKEDYVQAALKQPQLFYRSPETIAVKFDLYKMFINEFPENILKFLLNYPTYFAYAPERIMTFYVISKLAGRQLSLYDLIKNPDSFARKILSPDIYQNIFKPLYDYFRQLFERRRRIKRKVGNVQEEVKATLSHAQRIIEYFGPKEQIILTQEQLQKIENLAQRVKKRVKTRRKPE